MRAVVERTKGFPTPEEVTEFYNRTYGDLSRRPPQQRDVVRRLLNRDLNLSRTYLSARKHEFDFLNLWLRRGNVFDFLFASFGLLDRGSREYKALNKAIEKTALSKGLSPRDSQVLAEYCTHPNFLHVLWLRRQFLRKGKPLG